MKAKTMIDEERHLLQISLKIKCKKYSEITSHSDHTISLDKFKHSSLKAFMELYNQCPWQANIKSILNPTSCRYFQYAYNMSWYDSMSFSYIIQVTR